jgi:cytochrome P450
VWRFAQFEEEFIRGGMLEGEQRSAWYARPDYQQLRSEVMGFFRTLVKARLKGERAGDNFDLLLDALKAEGKLRDEDHLLLDAYLMQAAGAGNMAATCSRLLWVLLQNPGWLAQLRAEFAANDPRTALASGLATLPFMRTLLIENERRHPVTPAMPKLALHDIELGAYTIPQGSEVLHLFALSHFDESLYDDPFAFRPERWLSGGLVRPHAFGGGEHLCLGMNLSYLFVVLTLQVLLQHYEVSAGGPPYPKPVADTPNAPTRPAFTIRLAAEPAARPAALA